MRLLLDLLAECHGPATSLRVLALFDKEFNKELMVPDITFPNLPPKIEKRKTTKNLIGLEETTCIEQYEERYDMEITFKPAPAEYTLFHYMKNMVFIYTIELSPSTTKTSIIPIANLGDKTLELDGTFGKTSSTSGKWKQVGESHLLENLDPAKEYTVQVNTVVNGITLASIIETFGSINTTKTTNPED